MIKKLLRWAWRRHRPVLFVVAFGVAGAISVSTYALTSVQQAAKPPIAKKPAITSHHVTQLKKSSSPKASTPVSTPAPTPAAVKPATSKPVSKPAASTPAPTNSPAVVASTGSTPGTGVSSLTPTGGTTTPPDTSGSSGTSPSTPCVNAPGTYTSGNWAGYLKTGCTFTAISGAWTVPSVTGNGTSTSADAAWIGIGGVTGDDLIQVGTEDTVAADGTVASAVFYELLPDEPKFPTTITVSPGDQISAALNETSTNQWRITITDTTTAQTFSTTVSYTSSYSSAEWIEEDPSYSDGSLVPLDNFDTVTFTNASATGNGTVGDLSDASMITLLIHRHVTAIPSAVSGANSDSFTVTQN